MPLHSWELVTHVPWPQVWYELIQTALAEGIFRDSRDGPCHEIGPVTFAINSEWVDLMTLEGRNASMSFGQLEQLTYLAGSDPEPLLVAAPGYTRFRDGRFGWTGAYGPRLHPSLYDAAMELHTNPDSRRAVVPLWNREDLLMQVGTLPPPLDLPCTLNLGFWRHQGGDELNLHAIMRSCDLWLGIIYDLPAFVCLQRAMAWSLGCRPGSIWFTATSLHLYERNIDRAREVKLTVTEMAPRWKFPQAHRSPYENWNRLRNWAEGKLTDEVTKIRA